MNPMNRKIFYRRKSAAVNAYGEGGIMPIEVLSWKEDPPKVTNGFIDKRFLESLFETPRSLVIENVGEAKVSLLHPSPWAIFPLVSIERKGVPPVYRIHEGGSDVSGFAMARLDFEKTVEGLRQEQGVESESEEDTVSPGMR